MAVLAFLLLLGFRTAGVAGTTVDGGPHLFVSFKNPDGTWGEAIDLSQHGLDVKAGIASIKPDGRPLFFGLAGDFDWVDTKLIEELRPGRR